MIVRWWIVTKLQLTELFVSWLVHLSYGLYIFSTAVAGDVSQTLSDWIFKPNFECSNKETKSSKDLPPIVLVHGIFGFGKGGCDGSVLLDTTPSDVEVEKLAPTNGVTVEGYELIDEIKAELEENCQGLPHYEVSGG